MVSSFIYTILEQPQRIYYLVTTMSTDRMMRIKLIERGSESLQYMLDLARRYSAIEDRDRCMILRSNALLVITGLLELHRSVFDEGVEATMEELLESRQKCEELLMLLANTARQTLEEDGQRIKDFITVSPPSFILGP